MTLPPRPITLALDFAEMSAVLAGLVMLHAICGDEQSNVLGCQLIEQVEDLDDGLKAKLDAMLPPLSRRLAALQLEWAPSEGFPQ